MRRKIRARIRRASIPKKTGIAVTLGLLYASLAVGALSVAAGSIAFTAAHVGVYAAVIVGGAFAFGYSAATLYAIGIAKGTIGNELQ